MKTTAVHEPRNVRELASAKKLSEKFLHEQGLSDRPGGGILISYYDANGDDLYVRTRGVPGDEQRFRQPAGVKVQPYGLWRPVEWRDSTLYLTEGETDTLTLWYNRLPALGLPGAQMTSKLDAKHIETIDRLYVCVHSDEGGEKFLAGVSDRLGAISYAGRASAVRMPAGAKDVNVLYANDPAGFGSRWREQVGRATTIPFKRAERHEQGKPHEKNGDPVLSRDPGKRVAKLTACDSLCMRPTAWLVPDFVPRGGLTLLAGDGGEGKSAITLHLAAMVSQGESCFALDYPPPRPGLVVLVGCEDDAESTILPRLAAAGARLGLVRLLDTTITASGDEVPFTLGHVDALDAALDEAPNVDLVVIDPVAGFVPGQVDDHRDTEVRGMLRPLAEMAARRNLAVVLVKHLTKTDSANSGDRISGSRAYVNAARAAFLVGPDPNDPDSGRCVMVYSKRNLSPRKKGLAYSKEPLNLAAQDDVLALPQATLLTLEEKADLRRQLFRIVWHGETDVTDRDLARSRSAPGSEKITPATEAAADWLGTFLAAGPKDAIEVHEAARKAGVSRNATYAARQHLKIVATKQEFSGKWHWELPRTEDPRTKIPVPPSTRDGTIFGDLRGSSQKMATLGQERTETLGGGVMRHSIGRRLRGRAWRENHEDPRRSPKIMAFCVLGERGSSCAGIFDKETR